MPRHMRSQDTEENEEYLKGEISGIESFLAIPTIVAETSEEIVKFEERKDEHTS